MTMRKYQRQRAITIPTRVSLRFLFYSYQRMMVLQEYLPIYDIRSSHCSKDVLRVMLLRGTSDEPIYVSSSVTPCSLFCFPIGIKHATHRFGEKKEHFELNEENSYATVI